MDVVAGIAIVGGIVLAGLIAGSLWRLVMLFVMAWVCGAFEDKGESDAPSEGVSMFDPMDGCGKHPRF